MATEVFPPINSGDNEQLDRAGLPNGADKSTGQGSLSWCQPGQGH